jgi:hypothetical protein
MAMTASVSNTAYQKRRLRGVGAGVNRDLSHKDKHHLLSRRLHNGKTAIFTCVKAKGPSTGSEQDNDTRERDALFLRTLYTH